MGIMHERIEASMPVLEVKSLSVSYRTAAGPVCAVRDFSVELAAGESLAIVGETGSGKSTVALALMGLLPGTARVEADRLRFLGEALAPGDGRSWQRIRGRTMGMIFQDARGALNPVRTIGAQFSEVLRAHQRLSRKEARSRATALLTDVGIPQPPFTMRRYPLELSGGMCQRVGIAMAICHAPSLLIADEPTSALDPSIQAQVLEVLRRMKERQRLAMLLISHDLAMVAEVVERVAVLYHGRMVECGAAAAVFRKPAHPYTAALIACQADLRQRWEERRLIPVAGAPPASGQRFPGCAFAPRCPEAIPECSAAEPPLKRIEADHCAACIREVKGSGLEK
jgi:oligopeptide/dipeptide ABC transporter ATP-binding protein